MKTMRFLWLGALLLSCGLSQAQVSVTVNSRAPVWRPPVTTERYYYIPEIETYYDVRSSEYIYVNDGMWVRRRSLPVVHRNYDLNGCRKVVINDYRGNAPYVYYTTHKVKYVKGHGNGHAYGHYKHKNKGHGHKGHGHGRH